MRRAIPFLALALLAAGALAQQEATPFPACRHLASRDGGDRRRHRADAGRVQPARSRRGGRSSAASSRGGRSGGPAPTPRRRLTTDVDVTLGDVVVPKGTYTLYTLPGEKEWKLIVNRQTGQWGTEYDPKLDLARIPMKVASRDPTSSRP